jgi:cysteine desulfurase
MLLESAFARIALALPKVVWLAHAAERMPNTMSLVHPGVINGALVMRVDLAGIAVSTGSACMAARGEPSHVIAALGIDESLAKSVIRVSIGPTTTAADLDAFAQAYITEVKGMMGG